MVVSYLPWGWEQNPGPLQEEDMLLILSHLSSPWHSFSSLKPILELDVDISAVGRPLHWLSVFEAVSFIRAGSRYHALGVISETPELQRPFLHGCLIASISSILSFTSLAGSRRLLVLPGLSITRKAN